MEFSVLTTSYKIQSHESVQLANSNENVFCGLFELFNFVYFGGGGGFGFGFFLNYKEHIYDKNIYLVNTLYW